MATPQARPVAAANRRPQCWLGNSVLNLVRAAFVDLGAGPPAGPTELQDAAGKIDLLVAGR